MIVDTQRDAANALGISDRQLRTWLQEPDFPHRADGKYDLQKIRAWQEISGRKGSAIDEQVKKIRARTLHAKMRAAESEAGKREREEAIAEGNILERDEYELFVAQSLTLLRDNMLSIPDRVARFVPAKLRPKVRKEVADEIAKFLLQASRALEGGPDDVADD